MSLAPVLEPTNMKKLSFLALILALLAVSAFAQKEKITAEQVIQQHLASIGTPEARAAAKSRVMVGQGNVSSKQGYAGSLTGPAEIASDGDKFLLAIVFNSNEYPYEKVAFDGKDLTVGRDRGRMTRLGEFVKAQSGLLKDGLMGGVLSSAWPLLSSDPKAYKAEFAGTEEVDGQTLYKLKISTSHSALKASLYFDAATGRHVMSEYLYTIQPHLISSDSTVNPSAKASHYSLVERFSDFKKVGDLTLPLRYTIDVSQQTAEGGETLRWVIAIKQVYYNEPLEAASFKVS